ncbi:MAG TPA: antitoxin Xre/MbcA/ParS toxin-binding domain-containing protein [Thermoanaerobaculia bacterium]|nr:antitoxin Xre/MbcA/ParS toxin-binding domain-containing protein [Thermoanaerobaculia bacterium]
MSVQPLRLAPSSSAVLSKAVDRAAEFLAVPRRELARVLGVSESSLSRLAARRREIDPESKEGELALAFLRVFRSLDALLGGDSANCRRWLRAYNHHLAGVPADLLQTVPGLVRVGEYLDALRGKS